MLDESLSTQRQVHHRLALHYDPIHRFGDNGIQQQYRKHDQGTRRVQRRRSDRSLDVQRRVSGKTAHGNRILTSCPARCAIAPLIIGPVTEVVGRRYIYIFSHLGFTLTFLLLAIKVSVEAAFLVSQVLTRQPAQNNMAQVIIGRGILGLFGCVGTILVSMTSIDDETVY